MHIIKKHNISIKKSKLYLFSFLVFSSSLLSCIYNPFKKYANDYDKVVWVSTENSSIDMKMYILDKKLIDVAPSLCIINRNGNEHYLCGFINASLGLIYVDNKGIPLHNQCSTNFHYLEDNKFISEISDVHADIGVSNYFELLKINEGDNIELEMKEFDQEKEATPLMFSNVKYISDSYNFETYSRERGYSDTSHYTFFVSYGSMLIDNVKTDIALKFLPENKFFIFRNDNIEDIIISGTYTNSWTDITLNFEENKIDNNASMKVKAEFLNNKN